MDKKNTYIDLFAGAGGLSEGFIRNGFVPIAHVEMDENACHTLQTRLAYHYLKNLDKLDIYIDYLLGNIDREKLYIQIPSEIIDSVLNYEISKENHTDIFEKIAISLTKSGANTVDIIVGGPPCQAYSIAGRSADKDKMKNDHRNYLYKEYATFLKTFRPKLFVFENVPGIHTANNGNYFKNLMKYFKRIGYHVEDKLLDASDFGVLQRRKRVIVIGWRKDLDFSYPEFDKVKSRGIVGNLLSDLPFLNAGEEKEYSSYRRQTNTYLDTFEIRNGIEIVTQNIARPHNKKDLKIYELAIDLWENKKKRVRNNEIPKKIRTQKNITSFLDRFKVVDKNGLSHTLIAHIAKDGHHYIHPDKKQLRSISIREAARIQSFPDDYYFEGSRSSAFKQIGNAVPPLMAEQIAKHVKGILIYE